MDYNPKGVVRHIMEEEMLGAKAPKASAPKAEAASKAATLDVSTAATPDNSKAVTTKSLPTRTARKGK